MTLPILIAAADLGQDSSLTLGLAVVLGGGLLTGALAYARLYHRAEGLEKVQATHGAEIEALKTRTATSEMNHAVTAQQMAEVLRLMAEVRADVKTLLTQGTNRHTA